MSQTSPAAPPPAQIIIIKRGGDQEEAHHGGVWKIAFADFMTAMMAFFLVMWLTSVSDDATKKQIAQYFNPIKLNSSSPETLDLQQGTSKPSSTAPKGDTGTVKNGGDPTEKPMSGMATGGQEEALIRAPNAVLAEIAAEGGAGIQNGVAGVPNGSGLPGLNGGDAYRDPFDPTSWQLSPNMTEKAPDSQAMTPPELGQPTTPSNAPPTVMTTTVTMVTPKAAPEAPPAAATPDASPDASAAAKLQAEADALEEQIAKAVPNSGAAPGVDVSAGKDGITISLADSLTSGMFEIGSAKPTPAAVALVETIAKLLKEKQGQIIIRGHTDSRPYAGVEYDNWRLSAARAQFAYYMLVRGGMEENRVVGIEGLADRQPKDAAHPESAVNRRIEILLKEPAA